MKFKEKQRHPWFCDMRRGDVQCKFVARFGNGYLNCTWREGHPDDLPHSTAHNDGYGDKSLKWTLLADLKAGSK